MPDRPEAALTLDPSRFFCLRTHLLPFDRLVDWGAGLAARAAAPADRPAALTADLVLLRERLQVIVARPEVREAIFVASPMLEEAIDYWLREPDSDRGQRAERALVKYLSRLAARPTPFGLFAGVATGSLAQETRLVVPALDQSLRHTRLDNEYLFALAHALGRDVEVRRHALYRPNDSLIFAAGHGRYAEARPAKEGHTFHLVGVDETPALRETLARAETPGGTSRADLAAALVDDDNSLADAERYIDELIESQVLVPDIGVQVTGPEPALVLADRLWAVPSIRPVAEGLRHAIEAIDRLDAGRLGNPTAGYREIAAGLEALPAKLELPRLFQVDLTRPEAGTLGEAVVREIRRGIELLHRITPMPREDPLATFTRAFIERYEGRAVPLLEVLDEEVGIGGVLWPAVDPSPLLKDLPLSQAEPERVLWGPRAQRLLHGVGQRAALGQDEWRLSPEDMEALTEPTPRPLPDAGSAMLTIAATSEVAVARGDFEVLLYHADGPSGARMLGRFCHADAALSAQVVTHLRAEEAFDPDAVYAEVVHLSEGRLGNILLRPLLREHEITFLGRSGAPHERQIPASDLLVLQGDGRIQLWSRRLGRRVLPRLSSAHNYGMGLAPYRFLCLLQGQGRASAVHWDWGPLAAAPFLPRVKSGRVVLSLARWRLVKDEILQLTKGSLAQRFDAVQVCRNARRLPQWVAVADGDNRLPIDLDNPLAVDCLLHEIGDRDDAVLEELWPGPDRLLAGGPEGRYRHEILVPFTVGGTAPTPAAAASPSVRPGRAAPDPAAPPRRFLPGSEWLYLKLYTSQAGADEILSELVGPQSRRWIEKGAADGWFFIRYSDPEYHLRWRIHGESAGLWKKVWPAIQKVTSAMVNQGRVWRVQLDTYEREVERYGGPEAMLLAERLFQADSEAVIDLVDMLEPGDAGLDERWQLALRGADQLLEDFGIPLAQRLRLVQVSARHYGSVPEPPVALRHQLTARFRELRPRVEALLDRGRDSESSLGPGLEVLRERTARWSSDMTGLRELHEQGRLETTLVNLAGSCIHMHLNRLLRGSPNAHESVVYDFLRRLYQSRAAREKK